MANEEIIAKISNYKDRMSGLEFEKFLKSHFENNKYKVQLTPTTNDYGADLILCKKNVKTVVQAKRHKSKITNSTIQEVIGAKGYYKANKTLVVTNSYFTDNAVNLAKANNVELWDRDRLIKTFSIA